MFVYRLCYVLLGLSVCFISSLQADEAKYCGASSVVATTKVITQSNSININTANADELSKLKGIGKAKAAVKGIGPALLEKNKALIRFED
jgi:DNA uptake protein ComE-like DNA-binding protein